MINTNDIRWFEITDSTNVRLSCDKEGLKDKNVYAAIFQTAGKGQRGNKWESGAGENLTFSILFKPLSIKAEDQFKISQAVTLGIVKYLYTLGITSKIKWPNDIYAGDLKICGILIENTIADDILACSITGIGLNMNQSVFTSDAPNPTSVYLQTEEKRDIKKELINLLTYIFTEYDKISSSNKYYPFLEKEYTDLLYRKGEFHEYIESVGGEKIEGKIVGIDKTACLLIEQRGGLVKSYAFKDIKYII